MTRPLYSDPLRNFRFNVYVNHPTITTFPRMGFMGVTGLAVATEAIPYREGGNNTTTRKMPGQTDFGPIGLTRGCMAAPTGGGAAGTSEAWDWFRQIFSVMEGGGTGAWNSDFRCGVDVDLLEHPVTQGSGSPTPSATPIVKVRFEVYNAWPMGISWSDLDGGGNAVVIESLQLAHEGFNVYYPTNNPAPFGGFVSNSQSVSNASQPGAAPVAGGQPPTGP